MSSSDSPSGQRIRSKAPDFSEIFRSANSSRHSSRTGAGAKPSPSSSPSPGEKPAGAKAPGRRSMLPFLGRKKFAEQTAMPAMPLSRKSVCNTAYPATPVNTVRRSFGNGHAVLMITPSSRSLPAEPPLPPKLPSVGAHATSFGSKLAAHFTPLRSPPRNSKPRSTAQKPTVPVPSLAALSPPVPEMRAPSIESERSSSPSRSTTPRPLGGPRSSAARNGDEEDFSDLFTRPDQLKRLPQSPTTPTTSVHIQLGDSPKKSGELTPMTPTTPLGPPLHFPLPPSTIIPPRSILTDKSLPRYSSSLGSLSSQGSKNPSTRQSPARLDRDKMLHCSQDERHSRHRHTASVSGSDTDTSKANDSIYSTSSCKLSPLVVKPPSVKSKHSSSSVTLASSGPPPSIPLPSPPLSVNVTAPGPSSAPCASPHRMVFPRPRANTLSITSNLAVPVQALPMSSHLSPSRSIRANSDAIAGPTIDELREALSQQRRKNILLQEYIITITRRYEDDRTTMAKNIEKLERNIRKKMREIEGLRWLVLHNGAISDIDAAANLARSSFSPREGDAKDTTREPSPLPSSPVASRLNGPSFQQLVSGQQGAGIATTMRNSTMEVSSDTLGSGLSFSATSVLDAAPVSTAASVTVIPERIDRITRAERLKLKEERRASKALRRISAASSLAMGTDVLSQSSSTNSTLDSNFHPKQSMDEVLEKLEPFRHT